MHVFHIEGGKKLKGKIGVNSAKNSGTALVCASLLVKGIVTLRALPRIDDVLQLLDVLSDMGVKVTWLNDDDVQLDTRGKLKLSVLNTSKGSKVRSALMFMGALAGRAKGFKLSKTGGCNLGNRTVRPHIYALEKCGVHVTSKEKFYEVHNELHAGGDVVMYESGDTTTENILLAAVQAKGKTVISFASANYMVQDLAYFLVAAGAKIEGIGTTTMTVEGVSEFATIVDYAVMPDPIEAMTWISLGVTTASAITVENCPLDFLSLELEKLAIMGQKFKITKKRFSENGKFRIADITIVPSKLKALPDKIYGRPFPGLNIDNLPLFVPILTQAAGRTLVHDWVYENRAIYYLELQKLGANLLLLDPHRILVEGVTQLQGNEVICPSAIRPAVAILIAMLAARGKSVLRNVHPIERGYEDLVARLQKLGADISVHKSN